MKYSDFLLNIPPHLLTINMPDLFIQVCYEYEGSRVKVYELALMPGLGKKIKDWEGLEKLAQERAEQKVFGEMDYVTELKSVL